MEDDISKITIKLDEGYILGNFKDLSGQRFGRWTVLERDYEIKKKNIYWKCKCDCGTLRSVAGTSLRGGISISCGCEKDEKTSARSKKQMIDLKNQTFGKWTVLRLDESENINSKRGSRWICKCACGTERSVLGYALRFGRSTSCGCDTSNRIKDLTGQRFHKLEVLHLDSSDYNKRYGYKWICKCDCGNEISVYAGRLSSGQTKSCGCLKNATAEKKTKYPKVNVGDKFGMLTVLSKSVEHKGKGTYWLCRCDCGTERYINDYTLKSGITTSCGCKRGIPKEDLTGRRFGNLYVLRHAEEESKRRKQIIWECQCDCGTTKFLNTNTLLAGNVVSCGCISRKKSSERTFIDITGQKYGRLLVLKVDHREMDNQGNSTYFWLCKCDCGNTKIVDGTVLRRGDTISCGCMQADASANRAKSRIIDLVGKKFGILTVLERKDIESDDGKSLGFWKCACDCGNEKYVQGYYLKRGMVTSCGCLKQSKLELYVVQYFDEKNYEASIDYNSQVRFENLRGYGDGMLSYDFAFYREGELKYLIECQGQQHYRPVELFGGEEQFAKQQIHDEIKREYAKFINVKLIEIPYTADVYDSVKKILDSELK